MPHEFTLNRIVEFSETDMAGIMHFSNFFRHMEATEHAFFRSMGLTLHGNDEGRMIGWARVHAECDYMLPVRYQDVLAIQLTVREKRASTLAYDFVFRIEGKDGDLGPEVAKGALKVVCVTKDAKDERMRATEMPAEVARLVEVAPPQSNETKEP